MASSATIDNLQIEIDSNAQSACNGIDALAKSLGELKSAVSGSSTISSELVKIASGLDKISGIGNIRLGSAANQIKKIYDSVSGISGDGFSMTLGSIATGLSSLSSVTTVDLRSTAKGLKEIGAASESLKSVDLTSFKEQVSSVAGALEPLKNIGSLTVGRAISQLGKIPDINKSLDKATVDQFASSIERLTQIMRPLAREMQAVYNGFSSLPRSMRSCTSSANSAARSFNSLSTSVARTASKFMILFYAARRITNTFSDLFEESSSYIENLNLFTVSMGDATDKSLEFARTVQDAMGIDISEWIKNQGVFMRLASGFGVASDKAELMSKNLTQLGYDMASYFNTSVETAMQKLQSGMSGQIKGLKAYGINLSVAALQETALSLGIDQSVRSMSEAQKAQLRYITVINRSKGIMGDMARTIITPANAFRILSAQFVQMKRAIGDVLSAIAVKLIPYFQVLVSVVTDAAKSIASVFGFKLPSIDYSGLELGSDYMEEMSEGLDDASASAKKLKAQLMGFDELNVLNSNSSSESNVGISSNDLGINLPKYDFLEGLDSKAKEATNKIKAFFSGFEEQINKFKPILKGLATALTATFAMKWLGSVLKKFTALKGASKILSALKLAAFQAGMQMNFTGSAIAAMGAGVASLWASFKAFMSGLAPFTKVMVSIIALATEFTVVSSAIEDLTLGNISLGDALMNIVPVAGAVGVAMYAMLGPVGLVATALVGVASAVYGFYEAEKTLREELVDTTFYDGQGTAISDLASEYNSLMHAVKNSQEPIITAWDDIKSGKESISDTTNSIANLSKQIELGYGSVSENVELITGEFEKLYEDTYDVLNQEANIIYTALAGSTGQALEDMGYNLSEIGLIVSSIVGDTTKEIQALVEENEKLAKSLNEGTADDGAMSKYLENAKEIARLSGVDTSGLDDFREKVKNLIPDDINWETDDLTGVFEGIATSTGDAKLAIEESTQAIIDAFEHMKSLSVNPEEIHALDDVIAALTEKKDEKIKQIEDIASEFVGGLQTNLLESVQEQYDAAMENWDSLSWLEKTFMYDGSKEKYVKSCLETYNDNIVSPIADEMKKAFSDTLSEDDVWAKDAMKSMLDTLFSVDIKESGSGDMYITTFADDVSTALDKVLPDRMKKSGENAVNGIVEGLKENKTSLVKSAEELGDTVLDSFDESMDIHSPSVEMKKRGMWTIDGFLNGLSEKQSDIDLAMDKLSKSILSGVDIRTDLVNSGKSMMNSLSDGVKNNKGVVSSALDGLSKEMTSKFNSMSSSCQTIMKNMVKNIASSVNGLDLSVSTTGASATIKASVKKFADGGFPVTGEMFVAREAGPELVGRIGNKTAVANNDQIIAGIASGVEDANKEVISAAFAVGAQIIAAIRESGDTYMDGEKVTGAVSAIQMRQNRMYGTT